MSADPIPQAIFEAIKDWCLAAKVGKTPPFQVTLHVNGDGKIVQADRTVKDRVTA